MGPVPKFVHRDGTEPDPRFSLANERTFLAWVRTSLALVAAGVAIEALELPISPGLRLASALLMVGTGLLAVGHGWVGWRRTEIALRRGSALPGPGFGFLIVPLLVLAVLLVVAGLLA